MSDTLTIAQRYRDHLTRIYNRLSLTALPERDPGVKDLPLDKVFVRLNVVVPAPPPSSVSFRRFSEERGEGGEFSTQRHLPRPVDDKERIEEERRWRQYREEVKAPPPVPISIATALQQHRHLVILGTPGSGKTTLLRWLAIIFAQQQQAQPDRLGVEFSQERVPILLELRRFVSRAQHWIDSPGVFNLAKEICQWIDEDARFAGISAKWMSQVLTQQPCLLLLDGLDEIADLEARRRLLESLEAFSQNPQYEKVRCLLTSRFHGFQGIALGASFQQTEVHPFSEEDIALFIRHWYATAYADMAESQAEAQQLIEAIQVNSGVKELAQNPLLCTIIAIIYRNNRILPNRRVELYWKCCEALLDTWERNKAIKVSGLIGGFDWQTKLELLMPVAYWFHEGNHGQLAVKEEEVVKLLTTSLEELRERKLSGGKPIEQEAREFIAAIRDRSGLLQGRGDGTLEFKHRTFQEYLAARYIAKQAEAVCIDMVMTHLHEGWWREVHLLVIGHLGSGGDTAEKATRLLLTILNDAYKAPSQWLLRWIIWFYLEFNFDTWLPRLQGQQRLAWHVLREFELVAQGYADCTPAGRTPRLAKALSDFAVQRVSQYNCKIRLDFFYEAQLSFLVDTLAKYTLPREEVETLFIKEWSNERVWDRRVVAKILGRLGQASEAVVTALVQALQDENMEMRWVAADSLVRLGQASEVVVTALIQISRYDDWRNNWEKAPAVAVAESLGRLGQPSEAVVTVLVQALQDEDYRVRGVVEETLGRLSQANEAVVTVLVQALQDKDYRERGVVAETLSRLGRVSEAVVAVLIWWWPTADKTDKTWSPRGRVKKDRFVRLGQAREAVVTALVQALQDGNFRARTAAAKKLGCLGQASEAVVTALVQALQDGDSEVRDAAAENLGRLGQASEAVVTALVQALRQDGDSEMRSAAAASLGRLGQASEAVVTALVQALQQDGDSEVRSAAAASLGRLGQASEAGLGQASEAVVIALVQTLRDKDSKVRRMVAETLGDLGQANETVVTALVQTLQDKDSKVRWQAAWSLGCLHLGQASEEVITVLGRALQDEDEEMRWIAAASLGRLGQASEVVVTVLIQALQGHNSWNRGVAAAESLGHLGQASEAVVTALVQTLRHYEKEVRKAAAESLGRLGQASEVVVTALVQKLWDDEEEVRKAAVDSLDRLGPASEVVITVLVQALRDEHSSTRAVAAEKLGRLGQVNDAVVTALVETLQKDDEEEVRKVASESLKSLSRIGQISEAVAIALVQRLRGEKGRWGWRQEAKIEAVKILGQLKLKDEKLWTEVLIVLQQELHDRNVGVRHAAFDSLRQLLEGRQIPGYRWRSLEERARFWQRFTSPLFEKLVLITLIGILLWLLGADNQIVQGLGIVSFAFTILPPLLFPPKP